MRALLDTHTFLWWNTGDANLSSLARQIIEDGRNELFLSATSAWEIAIKTARGKLILPEPPQRFVASRMALHHIQPLPIQVSHALQVFSLPNIHQDPFDRLLVAQSQLEDLPILTADPEIARYGVKTIW
jgi:PIN domain nuclease of toxin-antitoxin system